MEDTISTVKIEDSGEDKGNLSFGMPSMSGEPVVITYTTESPEDALQIQEKNESTNQEAGSIQSEGFSEALAGEQLLQMANAIVMEQGQMVGEGEVDGNGGGQEIIQTVDENGTVINEMTLVRNSEGEVIMKLIFLNRSIL